MSDKSRQLDIHRMLTLWPGSDPSNVYRELIKLSVNYTNNNKFLGGFILGGIGSIFINPFEVKKISSQVNYKLKPYNYFSGLPCLYISLILSENTSNDIGFLLLAFINFRE